MVFDIDLTGIEAQQFGLYKIIPEGRYTVSIKDTIEKQSSKGNPMVELALAVSSGDFTGAKLKHYVVFSDKTKGMVKHFLKCIGEPFEGKVTPDPVAWVGKEMEVDVIVEVYKKNVGTPEEKVYDQNKIQAVYPSEIPF